MKSFSAELDGKMCCVASLNVTKIIKMSIYVMICPLRNLYKDGDVTV